MPAARRFLPWLCAAAVLVVGWRATWFLCDDAFIAFRYVGNLHDGNGLVWNPAPFLPVEGYTSFLWVMLLWLTWASTGVEPPVSSDWLALLCSLGTLAVVARHLARLPLPPRAERWRASLAGLVLIGTAGNATFATWSSSGLETALFGLVAVGWTLHAAAARAEWRACDLASLAAWAAVAQLTRPEGALLSLATVAIAIAVAVRPVAGGGRRWSPVIVGLLPLALPVAHLAWRRWYYGEWLPNTYYAKVNAAWPECGLRYLYCFLFEHGMLLVVPFAVLALLLRRGRLSSGVAVAAATWLAYIGYYSFAVGGDHFGYRIYAHFVPIGLVLGLTAATSLRLPGGLVAVWMVVLVAGASVPGWAVERALVGREDEGYVRAATLVPRALRPLVACYDHCRAYCCVHWAATHRVLHARFCEVVRAAFPERRSGQIAGSRPGMRLLCRSEAVGIFGWALSDLAILDGHGLNDWYLARAPLRPEPGATGVDAATVQASLPGFDRDHDGRLDANELAAGAQYFTSTIVALRPATWAQLMLALADDDRDERLDADELTAGIACFLPVRHMAHERWPDLDYIAAFRPNVTSNGRAVLPDIVPLTDDEVRAVEQRYRAMVRR